MRTKRVVRAKPAALRQLSEADVDQQLERARLIEELLEKAAPAPVKQETFTISERDGKTMTGCTKGNERAFLEWALTKTHKVLVQKAEDRNGYTWLLEVQRGALLNAEPNAPQEALLIMQTLATHELMTEFGRRALAAGDASVQSRLAGRYVQLAELACKQAECVQRLRGEGQQRVTVGKLNVEDGGRAVVGHVHATQGNEDSKN